MRGNRFITRSFLPFQTKHPGILFGLCLLILAFSAFTALASDDVQQADAETTKQLLKQADKQSRKGNLIEAEKILRRVVELSPHDSRGKLELAYVLMKQRRLVEAYELSFDIAKKESDNSYAFAVLGMTLLNAGNFEEARLSLLNAYQLNKKEGLAWAGIGMLDFYENRVYKSLVALRQAVYLDPDEPDFVLAQAQVAARAEEYKEAAEAYRQFLRVSPQNDLDRRDRIKGLIDFLDYLGGKVSLYNIEGAGQTNVSFKLIKDRPVIQLRVNKSKEPLNFVLDTGSGISVISEQTAKKLDINPVARGGKARGFGGDGKFSIVYGFLKSINLGDVYIKNIPVYIRPFHASNEGIDGYIGLSLISKFITTIDYGNSVFTLARKDLQQEEIPAAVDEKNSLALPLRLTTGGFLSGEVQIEGIGNSFNFIVDTGASLSVISDDLANRSEISRFVINEKIRVIGSAGETEEVPLFMLPRVSFGQYSRDSIKAIALDLDIINETSGFEQAGILGGNFLKNYRLTFDFKNSKVIFVPVEK